MEKLRIVFKSPRGLIALAMLSCSALTAQAQTSNPTRVTRGHRVVPTTTAKVINPGNMQTSPLTSDGASTSPQTMRSSGTQSLAGLVSITVTPAHSVLTPGGQQQLLATGIWKNGSMLNISSIVTWASSAPSVATVSSSGLAQAVGVGTTSITASLNSITGFATLVSSRQQPFSVLFTFKGENGANPQAGLTVGSQGNFYGTASTGGAFGLGAIFELAPGSRGSWVETVLYSFEGGPNDGAGPRTPLLLANGGGDDNGDLYGMTFAGGPTNNGMVFKLKPDGTELAIYGFTGGTDGGQPYYGGLVLDSEQNLFGATSSGGDLSCANPDGCGVVFMLNKYHVATVLHSFANDPPANQDGSYPYGGVTWNYAGNLYGTTFGGGTGGVGTVFEVGLSGTENVVYNFSNTTPDGINPYAGLITDNTGSLYGTTSATNALAGGFGAVFKINASGHESLMHVFTGYPVDGADPAAGLLRDPAGNLYGTTLRGGAYNNGTIFKLDTKGKETVLYSFTGGTDGAAPMGVLVQDTAGNLYGTTNLGGSGFGVVFKFAP